MIRLIDRLMAALVLVTVLPLLGILPERWFPSVRSRMLDLWFDLGNNLPFRIGNRPIGGGADDSPFGYVRQFDDFNRVAIDTTNLWNANNDAGGTAFAINAQANGVVRGGVDGDDNDNTNMNGPVIYRATAGGPLICEWRVALVTSLANGETFIGMSDATTDELPIQVSATDAQTDAASDGAGFCYTGGGTASWKACAVIADTSRTPVVCNQGGATTPVLTTFQTFRIAFNADGDADFYIDGLWQANIQLAVTPGTLMNQYLAFLSGTTARSVDADYAYVSCGRVG